MSHDKLLAKINELPDVIGLAEFKVRHDALRAVVQLHSPDQSGLCEWCTCKDCSHMVSYPCKTIQKIEQVLS